MSLIIEKVKEKFFDFSQGTIKVLLTFYFNILSVWNNST